LAQQKCQLKYYTTDRVEAMVTWLMGWPSGIKLNNNLDNFLGNVALFLIGWWKGLLSSISSTGLDVC